MIIRWCVANEIDTMVGANLGIGCLPLLSDLQTESICSIPILEDDALKNFLTLVVSYLQENPSPSVARIAEQLSHLFISRIEAVGENK